MFIRDTSQWMQLVALLLLTFFYLYNFRALRLITDLGTETQAWWQAILGVSNIALASCIVAAISTRFVFPSVSTEGRAYVLIRSAPMSIEKLLWHKFLVWLPAIATVSVILLVSGAWASQAPPATVLLSAFLGLATSVGTVGLGIGVGAVYARFDWHSPTQVAASFGSLVYMLLSLCTTFVTLIPASFLIVLTCVPNFSSQFGSWEHRIAVGCSYFLVIFINGAAARGALLAGAQALRDRER